LIQRTRHLDSIVARALLVADFIDSIGQLLTLPHRLGYLGFAHKRTCADGA
jgi:hypothetical protein